MVIDTCIMYNNRAVMEINGCPALTTEYNHTLNMYPSIQAYTNMQFMVSSYVECKTAIHE